MNMNERLGFTPGKKVRVHPRATGHFSGMEGVIKEVHEPVAGGLPIEVVFNDTSVYRFRRDELLFADKADADAYAELVQPSSGDEQLRDKIKQVDFTKEGRNPSVLARLEEARARYEEGRVSGMLIVFTEPDGSIDMCTSDIPNYSLMLGALKRAEYRFLKHAEEGQ